MNKTKKTSLFIAILFISTSAIVFIFSSFINPPNIQLNKFESNLRVYEVPSTTKSFITKLYISAYPFAKTKLKDPEYTLLYYGESLKKLTNRYDPFLYAKKRIYELLMQGDDMRVGKFIQLSQNNPSTSISNLKKWWIISKPSIVKRKVTIQFNTWEASLARYVIDIETYINQLQANTDQLSKVELNLKKARLKLEIAEDQKNILNNVFNSKLPEDEKKYLENLAQDTFRYFLQKPILAKATLDFTHLYYDFDEIIKNREYGTYDLYFDPRDIPVNNEVSLSQNDAYYQNIRVNNTLFSDTIIGFKNIVVNDKSKPIILTLQTEIAPPLSQWSLKTVKNNKFRYQYKFIFRIPENMSTNNFVLSLKKTLNEKIKYESDMDMRPREKVDYDIENNKNTQKTISLIDEELPATSDTLLFQRLLDLDPYVRPTQLNFTIRTMKELDPQDQEKIQFIITPIYQPVLSLVKKNPQANMNPTISIKRTAFFSHTLTASHTTITNDGHILGELGNMWIMRRVFRLDNTSYQANLYFLPQFFSFFVFCLSMFVTIVLLISKSILFFLGICRKTLLHYTLIALSVTKAFSNRFKVVFLFTFFVGILIDIFIVKDRYGIIMLPIVFLWLMTVIGFSVEGKIHFAIAALLFFMQVLFMSIKKIDISEKTAGWVYLLIILGLLHSVGQKIINPNFLYSYKDFFKQINIEIKSNFPLLHKIFMSIISLCIRFIKRILKPLRIFISKVFILQPKNVYDWGRNLFALLLLICIAIFLIIVTNMGINYVRREIDKRESIRIRLTMNPTITHIEPKFAYYSTKIIIKGHGFGWQQNDKAVLQTQYGDVNTDLWTDTKIIFTIPLHWKTGTINLAVKKLIIWKGRREISQSAVVNITLLSRSSTFNKNDDEFFRELKNLDEETLQINGYSK